MNIPVTILRAAIAVFAACTSITINPSACTIRSDRFNIARAEVWIASLPTVIRRCTAEAPFGATITITAIKTGCTKTIGTALAILRDRLRCCRRRGARGGLRWRAAAIPGLTACTAVGIASSTLGG
jgi:hypothetical protein